MDTEEFIDYYDLLEIPRTASDEEIKKAYRKKSKEYHPDNNSNLSERKRLEREEIFKEIATAYEVLSNPKKRREYNVEYDFYQTMFNADGIKNTWYENTSYNRYDYTNNQEEYWEENNDNKRKKTNRYRPKEEPDFKKVLKDIITAYQEVKEEEAECSFKDRHHDLDRSFRRSHYKKDQSLSKEFIFHVGRGTVHAIYETLYQLTKFSYVTKDSIPKYILRNRYVIGASIAATLVVPHIFSSTSNNTSDEIEPRVVYQDKQSMEHVEQEIFEATTVRLNRIYTVKYGDTLSELAEEANIDTSFLKMNNDLCESNIYMGQILEIPYFIDKEDLAYYTKNVDIPDNINLEEFALEHETDVNTLLKLNDETVIVANGTNVIISDSLVVPTFTSKKDLHQVRTTSQSYSKNLD